MSRILLEVLHHTCNSRQLIANTILGLAMYSKEV
jgi:hypothetical protein